MLQEDDPEVSKEGFGISSHGPSEDTNLAFTYRCSSKLQKSSGRIHGNQLRFEPSLKHITTGKPAWG
jgi:hypothetical protein